MKSRTLYSYNLLSFQYLKNQYKEQAIELIPAIKMDAKQIKLIQENPEKYVVDISDFVEYLNERRSEIHTMTLVLSNVDFKIKFICDERLTNLALEIIYRGMVPFYCAAWSNIKSVRNAIASGFRPAWVEMTVKPQDFVEEINR